MTLPRTIHRREARKRAKARKLAGPGRQFIMADWLMQVTLRDMERHLRFAEQIRKVYR